MLEAHGEVVLFTDDDCLPERDWVEVMLRTFADHPETAGVEGLTYTKVDLLSPFLHFAANDGGVYPTCNIGYQARILRSIGGFDVAAFPDSSAEDVDVGYRVLEQGPIVFESRARVFHPPRAVGFWWQVGRGRYLIRDDLCLRRRHASRYGRIAGPLTRPLPPVHAHDGGLCITSLGVTTARHMLFRADLIRRPALYLKYVVMLALRTSYAMWVMPWSLYHVHRHRDAHTLPSLPEPDTTSETREP